jgi:hypothetical protein
MGMNNATTKQGAETMIIEKIKKGNFMVIIDNQNTAGVFQSRIWSRDGERAGYQHATHKTLNGARKWANKTLANK